MNTDQKSAIVEAKEAILDHRKSIDESVPGTPFGLVALSYLAVLAIACAVIALFVWTT